MCLGSITAPFSTWHIIGFFPHSVISPLKYNYFADCSTECPYKHAVRGTHPWWSSEHHDNMHNWCTCKGCCSHAYSTEGNLLQSNYTNAFLKA